MILEQLKDDLTLTAQEFAKQEVDFEEKKRFLLDKRKQTKHIKKSIDFEESPVITSDSPSKKLTDRSDYTLETKFRAMMSEYISPTVSK